MSGLVASLGLVALVIGQVGVTAAPAGAPDAASLAIWRLKPLGMDAPTAGRLEGLLRAEAGRVPGMALQAADETERRLRPKPELAGCSGETACLCEIGRALAVDKLVTGVIGALGDDYTFDLKLVDVAACREERRINEALNGREDLLIGAVRQALYKLVAPKLVVGSLSVEVPVEAAQVEIDGRAVAQTPLASPITGLRPGLHQLKIVKPGFRAFEDEVPVRFQQTTRVKVDLVKSVLTGLSYEKEGEPVPAAPAVLVGPAPPPETSALRILAWSTAGLAVASAATAGVFGWRALVAQKELEQAASGERPYLNAKHQDVYERGETYALASNIGWGVAAGAAVASIVLFVVDLTGGEPEPSDEEEPDVSLGLGPRFSPGSSGVQLRVAW